MTPKDFRSRLRRKAGSTLIWALIVVVVITMVLAAGFNIIQRQHNSTISQHIENQAYYSAMSVERSLLDWLNNTGFEFADGEMTSDETPQGTLINFIMKQPLNTPVRIEASFLETGSAGAEAPVAFDTVTIYATHTIETLIRGGVQVQADVITFKTTAEFLGDSATVSGRITNTVSEWEIGSDAVYPIWEKLDVPAAPDKNQDTIVTLTNNTTIARNPSDVVYLAPKGATVSSGPNTNRIKRIYVEGTLNLSNNFQVDEIIVESGGVVHFASNNLSINKGVASGTLYIKPGGTVTLGNIGGNIAPNLTAVIYAWLPANAASFNPDGPIVSSMVTPPTVSPPAFQLGAAANTITFNSVIVQPFIPSPPLKTNANGDELVPPQYEFMPSYSPDIGNIGLLIPQGSGAIHIPEGYLGMNAQTQVNRQTAINFLRNNHILPYSCNYSGNSVKGWTRIPELEPFCPHFLAPSEPPPPTQMTASKWTIDAYYKG